MERKQLTELTLPQTDIDFLEEIHKSFQQNILDLDNGYDELLDELAKFEKHERNAN